MDSGWRAKVADFGLGGRADVKGTPYFLSPCVLRGEAPTTAADVYAFGKRGSLRHLGLP